MVLTRGITHVQCACGGVERENRPALGRANFRALLDVGGDRHDIALHERGNMGRVMVTHEQVRDLRIEQGIFTPICGVLHAVHDEGADTLVRRIVVAVGVPLQYLVAVGDVLSLSARRHHPNRGDAVPVGVQVRIQAAQTQLFAQSTYRMLVSSLEGRTRVDGHVRLAAPLNNGFAFRSR